VGGVAAGSVTTFFDFGPEFFKAFDARKLQKELLQLEVAAKQKKDKNSAFQTTWNPSQYVQEVVKEAAASAAASASPTASGEAATASAPEQEEEPFWERNKRVQAIAASHKPAELIKTGKELHFMNGFFLSRFVSDGGKILPRSKSGLTAKQQRQLAREIRKARQIGIIPIMQKFLPSFEANLPTQNMSNPLAGKWKPLPFMKEFSAALGVNDEEISREQAAEIIKQAKDEIQAERDFQGEIKLGLAEIDQLKTTRELIDFLVQNRKYVPELFSAARLRFRAAEAVFSKMAPADIRSFLEQRGAEVSDCTKDEQYFLRVKQYLHAFEEQMFPESKMYNSIRFSREKMRLFAGQRGPPQGYRGGGGPSTPSSPSESPAPEQQ